MLVPDNDFATFDMLKDLENARNCLHAKYLNQSDKNNNVEII